MLESQLSTRLNRLKQLFDEPKNMMHEQNETVNNVSMPLNDHANLQSILYTNDKYQQKLNKRIINKPLNTIKNSDSFDEFVNNDIQQIKYLNWIQIPISWKYRYILDFIDSDPDTTPEEKEYYKSKTSIISVGKKGIVKYDRKKGHISKLNYHVLFDEQIPI
jgi:hypothetical protein